MNTPKNLEVRFILEWVDGPRLVRTESDMGDGLAIWIEGNRWLLSQTSKSLLDLVVSGEVPILRAFTESDGLFRVDGLFSKSPVFTHVDTVPFSDLPPSDDFFRP